MENIIILEEYIANMTPQASNKSMENVVVALRKTLLSALLPSEGSAFASLLATGQD